MNEVTVIGAGLAGCEAAWQAAELGCHVTLFEMRPAVETGAHTTGYLAELVCSNSLGSNLIDRASGLLKAELRRLGSMLLACAEQAALPAGGALAVDRQVFAELVTSRIQSHPRITLVRQEVRRIPAGVVITASGPLTSPDLAEDIQNLTGERRLFFYDAIAPIVTVDSINPEIAFRASRYEKGLQEEGDYLNCPFETRESYLEFVQCLREAQRIRLRDFETPIEAGVDAGGHQFFEGCLPVEVLARRGDMALAYGPMRPVGLRDPRTGKHPFAVVQLRQDNLAGSLYNLVGFQTNLTFGEQRRVFRMIPGLENADFARYGQMHRNTFIASPLVLLPTLQTRFRQDLFFAGQITGVEGYIGNIATGLLAGINATRLLLGQPALELPATTMLGALCRYVTQADMKDFQPMKANFGILPELMGSYKGKRARAAAHAQRALDDLDLYLEKSKLLQVETGNDR